MNEWMTLQSSKFVWLSMEKLFYYITPIATSYMNSRSNHPTNLICGIYISRAFKQGIICQMWFSTILRIQDFVPKVDLSTYIQNHVSKNPSQKPTQKSLHKTQHKNHTQKPHTKPYTKLQTKAQTKPCMEPHGKMQHKSPQKSPHKKLPTKSCTKPTQNPIQMLHSDCLIPPSPHSTC